MDGAQRSIPNNPGTSVIYNDFYAAKWNGDKITIDEKISMPMPFPFGPKIMDMVSRQVWSLSDDGKTLMISTSTYNSQAKEEKETTMNIHYHRVD